MRRLLLLAPVLLAACATAPAGPVAHDMMPGPKCDASQAGQFIGRTVNSETGNDIQRVTHSTVLRWAPPGTMLTMDYSASRVTVRLGPRMEIFSIDCG